MDNKSYFAYRIDERVFLTMAVLGVISMLVLAFKIRYAEPCQAIQLTVSAAGFYENTPVSIKAATKAGKTFEWDFGDGNQPEFGGSSAVHTYKHAGQYTINVTVNGTCPEMKVVYIRERPVIVNTALQPKFTVPLTAAINEQVTFRDSTPNATSWEWNFGDDNTIDAIDRDATHIYSTPGMKTVTLKINGRADMAGYRNINIIPLQAGKPQAGIARPGIKRPQVIGMPHMQEKPDAPPLSDGGQARADEVVVNAPEITSEKVNLYLWDVIDEKQKATGFSQQLCGNTNLMVTLTIVPQLSKKSVKQMPFSEMCHQLEELKRRRVKNIYSQIKAENGCITEMKVTVIKTLL